MSEERTDAGNLPDDDLDLSDDFDEPEVGELDEGEESGGEEPQEDLETEEPQRRRARPGPRERRERAELRELREEQKRLRDELAAARQTYQQTPAQPRVDPYEEQRREQAWREQVSLLAPEQQIAAFNQRTEQRLANALSQQEQRIKDQTDRADWNSLCRTDKLAAQYRERVDAMAANMAPGAVPRELIFEKLLGEDIRKRRRTELPRQRREAAARVKQQTTTPAGGRSDGGRTRADARDDSVESARRRLAGKPLWN